MEFVGRIVRKEFEGMGVSLGTVRSCDSSPGFFEIVYDNGVTEVLELAEVVALAAEGENPEAETIRVKPWVGRKPKKRRRIERINEVKGATSVNGEEQEQNEVNSVEIFDLDNGFADHSGVIDDRGGKRSRNVDLNRGGDKTLGGECGPEMDLDGTMRNLMNGIDLRTGLDLDLNEMLDSDDLITVNVDYEENLGDKRRGYFDLNMDANCDLDELRGSGSHLQKRDRGFDLNMEVDVRNNRDGMNTQMNGHDRAQEVSKQNGINLQAVAETGELREVHIAEVSSAQSIKKILKQNSVLGQEFHTHDGFKWTDDLSELDAKAVDGSQSDKGHSYDHESGRKRRRQVLDNSNLVTETVLRRSTRRMSSRTHIISTATSFLADELSPCPAISGLTEEKTVIRVSQEAEEPDVLTPKPQLPPSSDNLRLDGLPLLDIFSVYSCLRSFSTLLFLSPFELEEFVEALKCMSPNLLFDSIHVSLLQLLRTHLEQLSTEGDAYASDCLRSLDWDTLDVVTYPLFVVEYLLFHCHNPGLDLGRLKLFRSEYFKQPATLKIEILRHLCDDMIDAEAVRLELNRRSLAPEFGMELDRNMNIEVARKKQAIVEMEDDSSINDEIIGDSSDWNSDECCLCKMDGSLLCCDGCPAAYHSKCVGVASQLLPEGDWYCPECAFDQRRTGLKPGKLLRGADFVETDPHGRQYYSCFGYLLVIDNNGSESLNYYHMNDLAVVLEVIKSCGSFYSSVVNAINKHWEIPFGLRRPASNMNSQMSVCLDPSSKGMITSTDQFKAHPPASEASMLETATDIEGKVDELSTVGCSNKHHRKNTRKLSNSSAELDIQNMSTEGSAETVLNVPGIRNFHEQAPLSTLNTMKESNANIHFPSCDSSRINTRKGAKWKVQSEIGYRNCYSFARMALQIAEEMMRKSLIRNIEVKSDEDIISTQVKTILTKSNQFHWRNIQSVYLDAWKEKCGWCYSCKNPSEDVGSEADCLFNMGLGPVKGLPESEIASIRSNNNKGHLFAVMCQVISVESRLQGLLLGPWLEPQYSRTWRENILKASNISSLKHLFLKLEANLHHRVLSSEWLSHVDSAVSMGSSVHIVIASTRSFTKSAISKQRTRLSESGVKPTIKKNGGLTMCWWRGGRLSRQLFNWKVLPRSLVSKAARQGHMRIQGILYPESSEPARRSRRVAWQAAVESSTSSEQLGLQVRELDSYIKWEDIENTHLLPALDKEARKSIRLFKKAIVRRKCLEGGNVKYLLDFGKRRNIPEVVLKNGSMVEESSSGRKKFWVNESCVPLHLLKGFEEKRIARKTCKMGSSRLSQAEKVCKRSTEEKGFSYLFARAEKLESTCCGHCNKDVLLSESVSCHLCQGFFHIKHVRKADNVNEEGWYSCHRCRGEMLANEQPKIRKRGRPPGSTRKSFGLQTQTHKKVTPARKSARVKKMKASLAEKMSLKLRNHKKVVTLPLRRSTRRSQPVWKQLDQIQNKSTGGNKKRKQKARRGRGRPRKVKQELSWRKQRTRMLFSYWSNGLLLSRKHSDERVLRFRRDRFFVPSENLDHDHDQPKCHLCASAESTPESAFIACEICGEWFHGDAFRLSERNIDMVIGFRCHACRKQSSPTCPHSQSSSSQVPLVTDLQIEDEEKVLDS